MRRAEADLFLIGGDATPPEGPWSSAGELLPLIAEHPHRPSEIGIAGYPEGHPLIDSETLADVLRQKSELAGYVTTQMCFDPEALLGWIRETRRQGVTLPVLVGVPGVVDRRRLLEMSMRIGVGPSLSFLRKQRGLRNLLGKSSVTPEKVYDAIAPHLDDAELNIAGFHYYTFNQLVNTWRWECVKTDRSYLCEEVVTK
jgi:methylenetetrahydrofolate reductase (NADPH)